MKKYFLFLFLCCLTQAQAQAPAITAVTVTLQDSQGTVWAGATYNAELIPPFGNPNPLLNNGNSLNTNGFLSPVSGLANGSGTFAIALGDNTVITPTGSVWKFTLCPNATIAVCSTSIQVVHGVTQNLSASISADLTPVTVSPAPSVFRAYNDTEVPVARQGDLYWRVTDNHLRGFTGGAWQDITSGAGGGPSKWSDLINPTAGLNLSMGNFLTAFTYGSATGAGGAMFDLSDANNNTGTGYIFRVHVGSTSAAKAFAACDNNLTDCVEFNGGAVFQALGNALVIANQVVNNAAGTGTVTMGSSGAFNGVSGVNTVELVGNNNFLYVSENARPLEKVMVAQREGVVFVNTGNTTENTVYTTNLPPLEPSSVFRITIPTTINAQGAVTTTLRIKINNFTIASWAYNNTTPTGFFVAQDITYNRNSASSQFNTMFTFANAAILTAGQLLAASSNTNSTNTGTAVVLAITIQSGANGDSQNIEGVLVEEI